MKKIKNLQINKVKKDGSSITQNDEIVEEAPLQIIVAYHENGNRKRAVLSVTMRTPGDDFNLVTGFLFCEGIICKASDIISLRYAGHSDNEASQQTVIVVDLAPHISFDLADKKRNFLSASACGFCGKSSLDSFNKNSFTPLSDDLKLDLTVLYGLPNILQLQQGLYTHTGGAHAVALLNAKGELTYIAEDVGRHNAMDKLIGLMLRQNALPLKNNLVLFSGRLSYELVQKALMAGLPFVCAIGAPTSLSIEMAEDYGMTIVGFLKNNSFNIYCGPQRIFTK